MRVARVTRTLRLGWRGVVFPACFVAVFSVACSSESAAPTGSQATVEPRYTAAEVEQLFVEWACPGDQSFALARYRPVKAVAVVGKAEWTITTQRGKFSLRESTGVFVPAPENSAAETRLRANDRCR